MVLGHNAFSDAWFSLDTYGGIVVFSGMTAYDTHVAIKMYKDGIPDHLECATQLYLNFVNILIRFIEILSRMKQK